MICHDGQVPFLALFFSIGVCKHSDGFIRKTRTINHRVMQLNPVTALAGVSEECFDDAGILVSIGPLLRDYEDSGCQGFNLMFP